MRIFPKDILNSRQSLELVQLASRIVPPAIGYLVAYRLADFVAVRRDWERVKAVRCNQWVARGGKLSKEDLDLAVRETFRNIAHSIYDLYHYLGSPEGIDGLVDFGPGIQSIIDLSRSDQAGKVLVSLHLGNFDLAIQALSLRGLQGMVFSLPPTEGGYPLQYKIRQEAGLELHPIDINTLRQAVVLLREGGTVITMVDWPTPVSKYSPSFFGQPSVAPIHYTNLAMKAKVPVVETVVLRKRDGRFTSWYLSR